MRHQKLRALMHFVWTTANRMPFITPEIERDLYAYIGEICERDGCLLVAIGGTEDHLHLLAYLGHSIAISKLMNHVKGSSSRFVNNLTGDDSSFAWQTGYGAFGVSPRDKDMVAGYVLNPKRHHAANRTWENAEDCT